MKQTFPYSKPAKSKRSLLNVIWNIVEGETSLIVFLLGGPSSTTIIRSAWQGCRLSGCQSILLYIKCLQHLITNIRKEYLLENHLYFQKIVYCLPMQYHFHFQAYKFVFLSLLRLFHLKAARCLQLLLHG